MRLLLLGVVLLVADYIFYDWGDLYGPYLADRFSASGEIKVADQDDGQVQAAFQRTLASQPVDAFLVPIDADTVRRHYEVRLTAPDRDQALEQIRAFMAKFAEECKARKGNVLWTSESSYSLPQLSPTTGLWLGRIKLGLLLLALAALAVGALLYVGPRMLRLRT